MSRFSLRLYQLILFCYPRDHRREYGALMAELFADQLCHARAESKLALITLWLRTLIDFAKTAPAEHAAALDGGLPPRAFDPGLLTWRNFLLTILPFVLNMIVISSGENNWLTFVGIAIALVFILIEWSRTELFPVWGLLLLGFISFPVIAAGFVPLALLLVVRMVKRGSFMRRVKDQRLPYPVWIVATLWCISLAANIISTWVIEGDFGAFAGAAGMYANSVGILGLTILLGLPLARRFGHHAMLFVIGAFYPFFIFSDPTYALGLWYDNLLHLTLLEFILSILFIIVPPLILLRARGLRDRISSLLLPVGLSLVLATVVPNMIRPYMTPIAWLKASLFSMDLFLALLLAAVIYQHVGQEARGSGSIETAIEMTV